MTGGYCNNGYGGGKSRRAMYAAALVVLAVLCGVSFIGARRMFRGVPLGSVVNVDTRTGSVKVDLGLADGILKGIIFSVVDDKGHQVALVTPAEVYDDMFWSKPLTAGEARGVSPGMQVRWIFTPELSMLVQARKKNSPEAYRNFAETFPDSVFLPQLIRILPEPMLKEIDPAFYEAWKLYTSQGFESYLAQNPKGGFSAAARAELNSIREYEAEQERQRLEREKRAAAYDEEIKRQEEVREKVLARQQQLGMEEMHGKLINNSSDPVKFVFEPPSSMPPTVVKSGEEFEVNHPAGSYSYKVFAVEGEGMDNFFVDEEAQPKPLAEGTIEIAFDFWELQYP